MRAAILLALSLLACTGADPGPGCDGGTWDCTPQPGGGERCSCVPEDAPASPATR